VSATAEPGPALLELDGVSAGYDGWDVLRDVSLAVRPGEIVGILGHNGAGKTTLLRLLAGLLRPTRGQVRLRGRDITRWHTPRRVHAGIALVPQGRALFAELPVQRNVLLGAFRRARNEAAAAWARLSADEPMLAARADTPVGRLSGGQQQIVANARGLASAPDILMVDEPSLGLSGVAVSQLAGFLQRLREAGQTTILVEQNVGLAARTCDRFIFLRGGSVIGTYAADELPREKLWSLF